MGFSQPPYFLLQEQVILMGRWACEIFCGCQLWQRQIAIRQRGKVEGARWRVQCWLGH